MFANLCFINVDHRQTIKYFNKSGWYLNSQINIALINRFYTRIADQPLYQFKIEDAEHIKNYSLQFYDIKHYKHSLHILKIGHTVDGNNINVKLQMGRVYFKMYKYKKSIYFYKACDEQVNSTEILGYIMNSYMKMINNTFNKIKQ